MGGRNAKMKRIDLMGRPAPLFPIPGEGEEAPQRMHTRAYLVQRYPSLCQDLLFWHNYAIASPFVPRALLPWCGLTIGLIQGQGKVNIAQDSSPAGFESSQLLRPLLVW